MAKKSHSPEIEVFSQKTQDKLVGKLDGCIEGAKMVMEEYGMLYPFAITYSRSDDPKTDDVTFVGDYKKKESHWDEDTVWALQKRLHLLRDGLNAGAVIYNTKLGKFDAFSISIEHRESDEALEFIIPYVIHSKTRKVKLRLAATKLNPIQRFIWKEETTDV